MKPCPNCGLKIARRDLHTCTNALELGRLRDRILDLEITVREQAAKLLRLVEMAAHAPADYTGLPEKWKTAGRRELVAELKRLRGLG